MNCCSVNGPRSLAMLSEWAIMRAGDDLVLNHYGPCAFNVPRVSGNRIRIVQTSDYPQQGRIDITLHMQRPERFGLRLRIPAWSAQTGAWLNGIPATDVTPGSYLSLVREWHSGDTLRLELDMRLRAWQGEREAQGKASLYRGPLLLAYDRRFDICGPNELPSLDLAHLDPQTITWTGAWPAPWVLLRIACSGSTVLHLCDFASAGSAGTPYRTWLPRLSLG